MQVFILKPEKFEIIEDLIIINFFMPQQKIFPGQFFMIGLEENHLNSFLLNRPFSVSMYKENMLEFRIRINGKFTTWLSKNYSNEKFRLIGPLGNGLNDDIIKSFDKFYLIGGGIGVAPLIYFYEYLKNKKKTVSFLIGLPSKKNLNYLKHVETNDDFIFFSDDGSIGKKGFPIDELDNFKIDDKTLIIACGPKVMYKNLKNKKYKVKVLMEEKMGCGFGVCLGCAIETIDGYKKVCIDGPLFDLNDMKIK